MARGSGNVDVGCERDGGDAGEVFSRGLRGASGDVGLCSRWGSGESQRLRIRGSFWGLRVGLGLAAVVEMDRCFYPFLWSRECDVGTREGCIIAVLEHIVYWSLLGL